MESIFRLPENMEMTPELLAEFIAKNDRITAERYKQLWDAYRNKYEIFRQPKKPAWKPDNRLAVNFAQYIVDTFEGYFLGIPIRTTSDDADVNEYVQFLDAYNDQDDSNAELSRIVSIFGRGYEIYYVGEEAEIETAYLDPMESFMIYSESIKPKPLFFVRLYRGRDKIRRGSFSDGENVTYFEIKGGLHYTTEPAPHGFDGVPATEYVQNRARRGIFENVLSLINEYNRALSEKANDVDSFSDAYLKILGAKIDAKTINFMRNNRVINFAGADAKDLVVDFLQRPNGDQTQENLLQRLERLIFTIAMVSNISDDNFATSSGIALKYKLTPMSNLAKTKERKFTSGLNRRYRTIFSNPVAPVPADSWTKLNYRLTENLPADLSYEAETAGALAGITSKKTQLGVLSIVDDPDKELSRIKDEADELLSQDYPTARTGEE